MLAQACTKREYHRYVMGVRSCTLSLYKIYSVLVSWSRAIAHVISPELGSIVTQAKRISMYICTCRNHTADAMCNRLFTIA